jgi:hypothetical protein
MNNFNNNNFGNNGNGLFNNQNDSFPGLNSNGFNNDLFHNPWKDNTRINIDSNGYATGERTSAGWCPNPSLGTFQPTGINPIGVNNLGQPLNNIATPSINTPIPGVIHNGYFAPNTNFMKY